MRVFLTIVFIIVRIISILCSRYSVFRCESQRIKYDYKLKKFELCLSWKKHKARTKEKRRYKH